MNLSSALPRVGCGSARFPAAPSHAIERRPERYLQCTLKTSLLTRTRPRLAGMCAHVAPRKIQVENCAAMRSGDRQEKPKNARAIGQAESSIVRRTCFEIVSREIVDTHVRSASRSFRLKMHLANAMKRCRMTVARANILSAGWWRWEIRHNPLPGPPSGVERGK